MVQETSVKTSLISGSAAGIVTDIVLYPIDTLKTRLQSSTGFWKSGGFHGVYKGIGSAVFGSAPGGASFFLAYEFTKNHTRPYIQSEVALHMLSACAGETLGCCIRIPFEVVKQNAQAITHLNSRTAFTKIISQEGVTGLYRGFFSMLFREIPFSLLQMPIWEFLKSQAAKNNDGQLSALHSGLCGSVAGGTAAALTTPLDVAKTRIILAQAVKTGGASENPLKVLRTIAVNEGLPGLFAGLVPRVMWISVGGFVFLGAYDYVKFTIQKYEYD